VNATRQRMKKMSDHKSVLEQHMKDTEKELNQLESDIKTQLGHEEQQPEVTRLY